MSEIAFVNGRWSGLSEAVVSIQDRGFQFGDGVYEVIRTYGKAVFGLREHLSRLQASAAEIDIVMPASLPALHAAIRLGCEKCGFGDIQIYIQLTRGSAPRNHVYPDSSQTTWVMTFRETKKISQEIREAGVSIVSTEDIRWAKCHVKSLNLLPNVLAKEAAARAGAFEAIFVREGKAMEGAASNLFAVFNRRIITPPKGPYILSGITREVVLSLGPSLDFEMCEAPLIFNDLYTADEIFLTSTTIEVLSVVGLNGTPVGEGQVGKTTQALHKAFQSYVQGR